MRALGSILTLLLPVLILIGGLELALRAFPELVPFEILQHFHEKPKLEIAVKRDLPNRTDVAAVERDDGGPLLRKYHPHESVTQDFGDKDATKTIVTDDLGFCNPGDKPYQAESFDVIAIGDSLTWCTAVEPDETWPAFLGKELNQSIYNLGYPGVGLYEYLVFLRKFGLAKAPKVVVLNFTEGNDLRDALRYWRFKQRKAGTTETAEESPQEIYLPFLSENSYVANMLIGTYKELFQPRARDATTHGSITDARLASINKKDLNFRYSLDFGAKKVPFNTRNADRDELKHSIVVAEGLIPLDVFDEALREFKRLSEEHEFIPVITYSPSAHVAYQDFAVYEDQWVKPISENYSSQLRELMAARSRIFGIYYLDLTDPLREEIERQGDARAEKLLYYPGSIHYSIEGNRIIAREMAKFIRDLGA